MMSTQVQKSRQKCCVYFGAEEHSEIGADIFVALWDLITPPRVMHYHFVTWSQILCAGQALIVRFYLVGSWLAAQGGSGTLFHDPRWGGHQQTLGALPDSTVVLIDGIVIHSTYSVCRNIYELHSASVVLL